MKQLSGVVGKIRAMLRLGGSKDKTHQLRNKDFEHHAKPILDDLMKAGLRLRALEDLTNSPRPTPPEAVAILLKWIPLVKNPRVLEFLVRPLMLTEKAFDATPLTVLFESTESESLRWVIGATIESSRPQKVSEWVLKTVNNPSYGKSREMLFVALARLVKPDVANPVLLDNFNEFPTHVTDALGRTGGEKELAFLTSIIEDRQLWMSYNELMRMQINKAVKKIKKRLGAKDAKEEMEELKSKLTDLARKIAKKQYSINLDFSHESIGHVERILADIHRRYKMSGDMEGIYGIAIEFAAYIITVIEMNIEKGCWERDHPESGANSFPFYWRGRTLFVYQWCMKRILDDESEDIWFKYQASVLEKLEGKS